MDPGRPAAGQADDQRAAGRRRGEKAEGVRPAQRRGDRGKEGQRHAEDHGHEVHDVGAHQLLAAAGIAKTLQDAAQGRARVRLRLRDRHRADRPGGRQREDEGRHVEEVGRSQPGRRDQRAPQGRAGDHPDAAAQGGERGQGRHLVRIHEPRRQRFERRALQAVERGQEGGDAIERPRRRPAGERHEGERAAAARQADLGRQHHAAAVHEIGERAGLLSPGIPGSTSKTFSKPPIRSAATRLASPSRRSAMTPRPRTPSSATLRSLERRSNKSLSRSARNAPRWLGGGLQVSGTA
jgi:hypothetical protein